MFKNIHCKGVLIGQFYDLNLADRMQFPTPVKCGFQFGFGTLDEDKYLAPHMHRRIKRVINTTSEFLYVVSGKMTVDVFSEDETFVETVVLKSNQAFLQHIGGHRISIKKGTKYFELKQGPYFGRSHDKYDFEDTHEL